MTGPPALKPTHTDRAGFPAIVVRAAVGARVLVLTLILTLALTVAVMGLPAGPAAGAALFVPEWSWPLAPVPEVLRPFEKPPQPWKRGHRGVDLSVGADGSVSVLSPADGVVSFAGTVVDRGVLSIDHGGGRISSFEPVTTELGEGRRVGRGNVVAMFTAPSGGPPGHCGQPCLHWGVRVDGDYVDPLAFVMDRRPSVLLPLAAGLAPGSRRGPDGARSGPFPRGASPRRRRRYP